MINKITDIILLVALVLSCVAFGVCVGYNKGAVDSIHSIAYCESQDASGYYIDNNNKVRCIFD